MKQQLLYRDLAKYYDLIYSLKDYKEETAKLMQIINEYKKSVGKMLLDVGCGSGKHLEYFTEYFHCTGVDINESILEIAKSRVKNVDFYQGDMMSMKINKQFDIITCLFSVIGYVKTYANLKKTMENFSRHLIKGGIIIIEPWFTKTTFNVGYPGMTTFDSPDLKIARLNTSEVTENISIMDMHYLIAEKGKKMQYFSERHELGLFEIDKTLKILEEVGCNVKYIEEGITGRGIYIGVKR